MMRKVLGEAERLKLGGCTTVRVSEVVAVILPEVPVTVTVAVPRFAVLLAVSVKLLDVLGPVGLNEAVTPDGRPDADKFTALLKPFCGAMVIVLAALPP